MLPLFDCISLMAFRQIGPAIEVLFIREEFCLRLELMAKICRSSRLGFRSAEVNRRGTKSFRDSCSSLELIST